MINSNINTIEYLKQHKRIIYTFLYIENDIDEKLMISIPTKSFLKNYSKVFWNMNSKIIYDNETYLDIYLDYNMFTPEFQTLGKMSKDVLYNYLKTTFDS